LRKDRNSYKLREFISNADVVVSEHRLGIMDMGLALKRFWEICRDRRGGLLWVGRIAMFGMGNCRLNISIALAPTRVLDFGLVVRAKSNFRMR